MKLMNRVAVVTGGARGIGKAIGEALAREGASAVVADVDRPEAERTAGGLSTPAGQHHLAVKVDVSDPRSVERMITAVTSTFGVLDILVNNAGICPLADFEEITAEDWDRVLAVNLKGPFLCCRAALPLLKKAPHPRIINISSVAGKTGAVVAGAHYAASKGGLHALTWCLARIYASHGITANAVAPATTETDLTASWSDEQRERVAIGFPAGRLGRPEDIGAAVAFLASEEAGFITGEVLDVNGGFMMD